MFLNRAETRILDHDPTLDGGNLWVCEVRSGDAYHVQLSSAAPITVVPGNSDLFAVVHHHGGDQVEVSAHSIEDPTYVLSRINVRGTAFRFEGNEDVWRRLPRTYMSHYTPDRLADADHHLLLVNSVERHVEIKPFPPLYEGGAKLKNRITAIRDVPRQASILIEEGRDEKPLLFFSTRRHRVTQRLKLSIKPGTAREYSFRRDGAELWVSDPDYMIRLTPNLLGDWVVRSTLRIQLMDSTSGRVTGAFAFNSDDSVCAIARPTLGDVLLLDADTFRVTGKVSFDSGMPARVSVRTDGKLVAREWNTGRVLRPNYSRATMAAAW